MKCTVLIGKGIFNYLFNLAQKYNLKYAGECVYVHVCMYVYNMKLQGHHERNKRELKPLTERVIKSM